MRRAGAKTRAQAPTREARRERERGLVLWLWLAPLGAAIVGLFLVVHALGGRSQEPARSSAQIPGEAQSVAEVGRQEVLEPRPVSKSRREFQGEAAAAADESTGSVARKVVSPPAYDQWEPPRGDLTLARAVRDVGSMIWIEVDPGLASDLVESLPIKASDELLVVLGRGAPEEIGLLGPYAAQAEAEARQRIIEAALPGQSRQVSLCSPIGLEGCSRHGERVYVCFGDPDEVCGPASPQP